jgi:1-acyl-sn-glycerol-3-phosphate acyltransferase
MKILAWLILKLLGWKIKGEVPAIKKFVAIMAPHTSNWDFPIGMSVVYYLGIKIRYLGKKELFDSPFGWIFRITGGIPVDRSSANNIVTQVVDYFNSSEQLILGLAPEGTRDYVPEWKTGFYFMALKANVPIVLCYLDYAKKEAGIGQVFYLTGNMEEDLNKIKDFYRTITGKHPEKGIR